MKKELFYEANEQGWKLERKLKDKGYMKTSDCFWCQIYEKDNRKIILNRS